MSHINRFSLGTPAVYRIFVKGMLDESLADRLGGMDIQVTTALEGRIQDQSQLMGVLQAIYELRLPILAVQKVDQMDLLVPPDRDE